MRKTYICGRWPSLQLGPAKFRDGKFSTDDENVQEIIEASNSFGVQVSLESVDDTVPEEPVVTEEPPRPRRGRPPGSGGVRQGMVGSNDVR